MKIYTKGGDRGETALFGGERVGKGHPRVEALGALDELNANLGWVATQLSDDDLRDRLNHVQHDLFALGAELASPTRAGMDGSDAVSLADKRTPELERWIDSVDAGLPELRAFVLPGGGPSASALHLARTVCRRAERAVVRLADSAPIDQALLAYLNRLSDLLFVLARAENHRTGTGDVEWIKP